MQARAGWTKRAASGATIAHFRALVRPEQRFIAHGHRLSFGVVFDDPDFASPPLAARDASLFDQQGCLSAHVFYVAQKAREYAARAAVCASWRTTACSTMSTEIRSMQFGTKSQAVL